jgi:large subunit ribosomal protein L10
VNRAEKEEWVEKFREDFQKAQSIILTNHSGIGVNTVNELRSEFRANGVHYHVVKNTLARMAVEGTDVEDLQEEFRYPTAVAYSFDDAVMPAKIARDFAEEHEEYSVKAGFLNGSVIDVDTVSNLAEMPSKDEIRVKLLNLFQSAPTKFVQLLDTPGRDFLGVLQSRKDDIDE